VKFELEEIGRQLARLGTSGSFATRRTTAAGDLILEVQDVGRIWLPVTTSTARRLCKVARHDCRAVIGFGGNHSCRDLKLLLGAWDTPRCYVCIECIDLTRRDRALLRSRSAVCVPVLRSELIGG
jgi:hypothetical protein